jgi:hypothetical protein
MSLAYFKMMMIKFSRTKAIIGVIIALIIFGSAYGTLTQITSPFYINITDINNDLSIGLNNDNQSRTVWNESWTVSKNKTFYLTIPKNSTATISNFTLAGFNTTTANSTSGSLDCVNTSECESFDDGDFGVPPDSVNQNTVGYFLENYTNIGFPDVITTTFLFKGASSDQIDNFKLSCWNYTSNDWEILANLTNEGGGNLTEIIHSDCYLQEPLRLNYSLFDASQMVEGWEAEITVYSFPKDIEIDISGDGDLEFDDSGDFSSSEVISNITEITDYLSTCTEDSNGNCNVPIVLFSNTSSGNLQISDLKNNYTFPVSTLFSQSISSIVNEVGSNITKTDLLNLTSIVAPHDINSTGLKLNFTGNEPLFCTVNGTQFSHTGGICLFSKNLTIGNGYDNYTISYDKGLLVDWLNNTKGDVVDDVSEIGIAPDNISYTFYYNNTDSISYDNFIVNATKNFSTGWLNSSESYFSDNLNVGVNSKVVNISNSSSVILLDWLNITIQDYIGVTYEVGTKANLTLRFFANNTDDINYNNVICNTTKNFTSGWTNLSQALLTVNLNSGVPNFCEVNVTSFITVDEVDVTCPIGFSDEGIYCIDTIFGSEETTYYYLSYLNVTDNATKYEAMDYFISNSRLNEFLERDQTFITVNDTSTGLGSEFFANNTKIQITTEFSNSSLHIGLWEVNITWINDLESGTSPSGSNGGDVSVVENVTTIFVCPEGQELANEELKICCPIGTNLDIINDISICVPDQPTGLQLGENALITPVILGFNPLQIIFLLSSIPFFINFYNKGGSVNVFVIGVLVVLFILVGGFSVLFERASFIDLGVLSDNILTSFGM